MEQFWVNIYAIANIIYLFWYIKKYSVRLSPGLVVLGIFVFIAIMGVPAYEMLKTDTYFRQFNFRNVTLLPYIFLFLVTMAFLKPIFGFKDSVIKSDLKFSYTKVKYFIIVYIICAFVSGYLYYVTIINNSILENLAEVRRGMYTGEQITAYENGFQRIFLSFASHMNIPATLLFFLIISRYRNYYNKWIMFFFGIAILIPPIGDSIRTVSRGVIIRLFVQLLISYSFFAESISREVKRIFVFLSIGLLVTMYVFSMTITVARFGDDANDTNSSLICYWGQPPIIFNSQVVNIEQYAYGARFFYPIADFLGLDTSVLGKLAYEHFGTCFTTFIGDIWIDSSYIGVILAALIIPYFFEKLNSLPNLTIPHVYLMLYYCLNLQHGALVTGYGFCTSVFLCVVFYYVLKFITSPTKKELACL